MAKQILLVSHGHPDHRPGGGEIAAYNLHQQLNRSEQFESVFFARHDNPSLVHGGTPFSGNGKPGEILFYSSIPDRFRFSQPDKARIWRDFNDALTTCRPDVVHFHHYLHLGLEMFRQVRNYHPQLPIVLTLHEYYGLCHNHGQMVKTADQSLCTRSSPAECSSCFPRFTAQDFFLREQFIKSNFSLVERFIAPSEFLAQRYIEWGLPSERIQVIENILPSDTRAAAKRLTPKGEKIKLAFFGQINWFKGLDLMLEALDHLAPGIREQISVDICGSGLEKQPAKLRRTIRSLCDRYQQIVQFRGSYTQAELPGLMAGTDWVIIPSRWWENSPVVILEARKHGVPVVCSDIGGMAEKVEHGKTGLHFMARRAESLAEQITWLVENRDQQRVFAESMAASYDATAALEQHKQLYLDLTAAQQANLPLKVA